MTHVGVGEEHSVQRKAALGWLQSVEVAQLVGEVGTCVDHPALSALGIDNAKRGNPVSVCFRPPSFGAAVLRAGCLRVAGILSRAQDHDVGGGWVGLWRCCSERKKRGKQGEGEGKKQSHEDILLWEVA